MSEKIVYVLPGDPVPWARAGKNGKFFFDTQKQQKLITGLALSDQHGDREPYAGALHLDITFYLKIPKTSVYRAQQMNNSPHSCRPDLDNLQKFLLDAANGILYQDDALISAITSRKLYSLDPRIEFTITELK